MIKNYFYKLRTNYSPTDILFPMNIRNFESIIRLCQARAKLSCRNVVISSDVEEIKDFYNQMLLQSITQEADEEDRVRARHHTRSVLANTTAPTRATSRTPRMSCRTFAPTPSRRINSVSRTQERPSRAARPSLLEERQAVSSGAYPQVLAPKGNTL